MNTAAARSSSYDHRVEKEIASLRDLELSVLRERWTEFYPNPAPIHLRREFLIKAIAYQMQVRLFGGLKPETKRKLREIADSLREGKPDSFLTAPKIKPGTKLIRSWKGENHIVTALESGFAWKRKHYDSLSEVARDITGTRWNGLLFFGVKRRTTKRSGARENPRSKDV
jgi:hypothetical protein